MTKKKNLSDLRGVLVVAYEEGLQMGKVYDIYIEKQAKQITGISFKSGLLGIVKESFVSFENIRKLGRDTVIISSETAVKPLPKELKKNGLKRIKGFKVTTHDGTHIGDLIDLNATKDDGKITGLIMDEGKMLEIKESDITFGPNVIMVPVNCATHVKEIEEQKGGLLARVPGSKTVKGTVEKASGTIGRVLKRGEPEAEPGDKKSQKDELKAEPEKIEPEKGRDDKRPQE